MSQQNLKEFLLNIINQTLVVSTMKNNGVELQSQSGISDIQSKNSKSIISGGFSSHYGRGLGQRASVDSVSINQTNLRNSFRWTQPKTPNNNNQTTKLMGRIDFSQRNSEFGSNQKNSRGISPHGRGQQFGCQIQSLKIDKTQLNFNKSLLAKFRESTAGMSVGRNDDDEAAEVGSYYDS